MKSARPDAAIAAAYALGLILFASVPGPALADGDAKAGHDKAQKCEQCHGLDGISKVPEAPNLAGQVQNYLIEQLRAFKAGTRQNEMMSLVAPTLTPQDIEDLAAYYHSIPVTVGKPPGG